MCIVGTRFSVCGSVNRLNNRFVSSLCHAIDRLHNRFVTWPCSRSNFSSRRLSRVCPGVLSFWTVHEWKYFDLASVSMVTAIRDCSLETTKANNYSSIGPNDINFRTIVKIFTSAMTCTVVFCDATKKRRPGRLMDGTGYTFPWNIERKHASTIFPAGYCINIRLQSGTHARGHLLRSFTKQILSSASRTLHEYTGIMAKNLHQASQNALEV